MLAKLTMGARRPRHRTDTGEGAEWILHGIPRKSAGTGLLLCLNAFSSGDMSYQEQGRSVLAFVAAFYSS